MLTLSLASAALIALAWADPEDPSSEDLPSTSASQAGELNSGTTKGEGRAILGSRPT